MQQEPFNDLAKALLLVTRSLVSVLLLMFVSVLTIITVNYIGMDTISAYFSKEKKNDFMPADVSAVMKEKPVEESGLWMAPDFEEVTDETVKYGRELIANTSVYLGPRGKIAALSNGMNCQNCHLDAGTKAYGNNYSAVASTYPKFRARSGSIESIEKRVNDCIERSLNGKALDTNSREMKAIVAYMKWLGTGVAKNEKPKGSGLVELAFLDRPANPDKGRAVYALKCKSCHGNNGEGLPNMEGSAYTYPPLWGKNSYNTGAGLYRLSRFAGYVKANMPLGAAYNQPQLTDEEAWDLAAFVNSQDRPQKAWKEDWPDIAKKPVDHPFGPYSDQFSEAQHKYGPFDPIKKAIAVQTQEKSK